MQGALLSSMSTAACPSLPLDAGQWDLERLLVAATGIRHVPSRSDAK